MDTEYSIYLGQEQKNGFTGFLAEKNFFCVVEIFDGYTSEQGEQLMSALAEIGTIDYETLASFDTAVSDIFKRLNTPLDTSLAIGYKKSQTLYLKTIGTGEVYLGRGRAFERVITGPINAAGKYEKNDFYVFTTSFFTQSLKGISHTKALLHKNISIREFPEHIKQSLGDEDDTGAVSLFVKMIEHQQIYMSGEPKSSPIAHISSSVKNFIQRVGEIENRKKVGIGIVIILCLVLLGWNLSKGIQSRGGIQLGSGMSYDEKKQQVELSITQASTKTESLSEGLQLLKEAQGTLALLKKTSPKDKQQEISELQKKASDAASILLKRETKEVNEYYDFALESKNARGTKLALFEDKAYVLNPDGKVYVLTLEKKPITNATLPKKVDSDALISGYEKNTYVLDPAEGITKVDESGKGTLIIPKETQWASITSMQVYNGNIYLLDGGNNALYKYLVAADGYGGRQSYFKGSYADMDTTSTFAIDISVFVATKDIVTKYTAGLKDDFAFSIPGDSIMFTKIITHTDQTELYLWDKKNGALYITSRDGVYLRQIVNSQLSKVSDVEVFNNKALLLEGSKLFSIDL